MFRFRSEASRVAALEERLNDIARQQAKQAANMVRLAELLERLGQQQVRLAGLIDASRQGAER